MTVCFPGPAGADLPWMESGSWVGAGIGTTVGGGAGVGGGGGGGAAQLAAASASSSVIDRSEDGVGDGGMRSPYSGAAIGINSGTPSAHRGRRDEGPRRNDTIARLARLESRRNR